MSDHKPRKSQQKLKQVDDVLSEYDTIVAKEKKDQQPTELVTEDNNQGGDTQRE